MRHKVLLESVIRAKFRAGTEEAQEGQFVIPAINFQDDEKACYQVVYEDLILSIWFKHADAVIKHNKQALY